MYMGTVLQVLELFRESSVGCEVNLGLSSMPSKKVGSEDKTKNFLYVTMKDKIVDVQIFKNVDKLQKIGSIEQTLTSPSGTGFHFEPGERIVLPFSYYIFSYCEKVNRMRNSDAVLKSESILVHDSAVSINHTVQLLEILFKSFANKMQFTLMSKNFPDQLVVIHYINGNALFLTTDQTSMVLYTINLFRFKEFFGDYRILHVAKSNLPVDYAQFVGERCSLASRLGLEFREVDVC